MSCGTLARVAIRVSGTLPRGVGGARAAAAALRGGRHRHRHPRFLPGERPPWRAHPSRPLSAGIPTDPPLRFLDALQRVTLLAAPGRGSVCPCSELCALRPAVGRCRWSAGRVRAGCESSPTAAADSATSRPTARCRARGEAGRAVRIRPRAVLIRVRDGLGPRAVLVRLLRLERGAERAAVGAGVAASRRLVWRRVAGRPIWHVPRGRRAVPGGRLPMPEGAPFIKPPMHRRIPCLRGVVHDREVAMPQTLAADARVRGLIERRQLRDRSPLRPGRLVGRVLAGRPRRRPPGAPRPPGLCRVWSGSMARGCVPERAQVPRTHVQAFWQAWVRVARRARGVAAADVEHAAQQVRRRAVWRSWSVMVSEPSARVARVL